jgi:aryl-alcohol dehydrogenase-like predicted oxidoreductase
VEAYDTRNNEHTWAVVDEVRRIAAAHEVPMGRVALAWVRHRPAVSSVILGARRVAQLDDNLMALEVELSVDETARLDMASAPGIPLYPTGSSSRTAATGRGPR